MGFPKIKVSTPPEAPKPESVVSTNVTDAEVEDEVKRKKKKRQGYGSTLLSDVIQGSGGNRTTLG